jgi:integrase
MPAPGDRITERRDGRWMGRYTVQTPTGTERKSVYGRTYKEAQKKLALAMGDAARGLVYDDENQTVGEYITQWLSDSAKHTVKATTYRTYESQIRNHIVPALGKLKLSRLTPAHLQALYAAKLRGGKKPAGVRQMHAILHNALEQAVRFNLIPTNPASKVDPPKVRQEEITPLSAEQANKLLDVTRNEGDRFEALYVLALTTGLRIGELLGLKWSDIDFDTRRLRVSRQLQRGQGRSGEGLIFTEPKAASRRTVDLPTRTVEALKRHRKRQFEETLKAGGAYQDNALVFAAPLGTPLGPEMVTQRSFKPLLQRSGLPEMLFHDLRHTYATLLLARGVHPTYVQRALGHASIKMTLDRYSHWMPSMGRATAEAIDAALALHRSSA